MPKISSIHNKPDFKYLFCGTRWVDWSYDDDAACDMVFHNCRSAN